MLPSKPRIFYGRESEVENIMKMLCQESPRIAILGGAGMGKTTLARAVLHHPETCTKFEDRFFISAESATTSIELAALIGSYVGLAPVKDFTQCVVQHFSRMPTLLLILDNLDTVWEPIQSRRATEEFLSLLAEVEHLALIVCSVLVSCSCH
jgi:Cdc6-like AAA superfamily ATPase